MMKNMKKLLAVLFVLALLGCCALPAAASNVTYDDGAKEVLFTEDGKKVTDLFTNFKNAMPGDKLTQTVVVNNPSTNREKVNVFVRALGGVSDRDLLSKIKLTVKQNGENILYTAPAGDASAVTDWVDLGTMAVGGETKLELTLDIPIELDNRYQETAAAVQWEFRVEERPDPIIQTGDTMDLTLWLTLGGVALLGAVTCIVLVAVKRKKGENA